MEEPKKVTEKELKFAKNRNNAKRNLTQRLQRNPTAAEIMGLIAVRRQGRNESAYMAEIIGKAEAKAAVAAEAKAAAAAAAAEVRMKQKAAANEAKLLKAAAKQENKLLKKATKKEEKTAAKAIVAETKKAAKVNAKVAKAEAKALAEEAKRIAREESKKAFAGVEAIARNNLTRALGKAPRVANIRRLASIRHSGVDLPVENFLKVKNYAGTRKVKAKNSLERFFASNNAKPEIDVCAACELKKFLEKEEE
jgi:hypothetical protein